MPTYDAIVKKTGEIVGSVTTRNPGPSYSAAIAITEDGQRWQIVGWFGTESEANRSAALKKYRKLGYQVEICQAKIDIGIRKP